MSVTVLPDCSIAACPDPVWSYVTLRGERMLGVCRAHHDAILSVVGERVGR
jgi:hypothetical protein